MHSGVRSLIVVGNRRRIILSKDIGVRTRLFFFF